MNTRFGFDRINDVKPDETNAPAAPISKVDAAGERHGFVSREANERLFKREAQKEATVPLSIRPPLSVANRFITYCKDRRLSYWEGLAQLMDKAGV
ncbi:conserved hypothetical protein [Hyphomicrobiales bacterium]|nr:hypothetical protein [Parvibaculum sp.]CAH1696792.1 conserved hypothetical protein [Hyphomicrobiales bacterium]CAH1696910.1 conserved hypothetical protein [Hyphomicrobiales bacterium]